MASLVLLAFFGFGSAYGDDLSGNGALPVSELTDEYMQEKENLTNVDIKSREIMATIYEINMRMKNVSRKRDQLNNSMIYAESRVRALAQGIAELENKIQRQRQDLSRRMRAIYMLGDEGPARVVFSSASAGELEQSLKYLKLISQHDISLINSYEKNKASLVAKSVQMKKEVKRLLGYRQRVQKQEQLLTQNQSSKETLLKDLKHERDRVLKTISNLRDRFKKNQLQSLLNLSFFEHRGRLRAPLRGQLYRDFGLIEHPEFQYKLSHKGFHYRVVGETPVHSIYSGRVAFVGRVSGYGKTVIVDHGDHYYSVYAKADRILVAEGSDIQTQQLIAKSASDLYFEIRHFSDAIDPKPWLKKEEPTL